MRDKTLDPVAQRFSSGSKGGASYCVSSGVAAGPQFPCMAGQADGMTPASVVPAAAGRHQTEELGIVTSPLRIAPAAKTRGDRPSVNVVSDALQFGVDRTSCVLAFQARRCSTDALQAQRAAGRSRHLGVEVAGRALGASSGRCASASRTAGGSVRTWWAGNHLVVAVEGVWWRRASRDAMARSRQCGLAATGKGVVL